MESNKDLSNKFIANYSSLDGKEISLLSFERIFGGASRETYKIHIKDQSNLEEKLILRRTQKSSLFETSLSSEYLAYSAYQVSSVAVPA